MNKLTHITCVFAAVTAGMPALAQQQPGLSVGASVSYGESMYKDTSDSRALFPMLSYDNGQLFLRGLAAGVRLNPKGSTHNVVAKIHYDPRSFDPSDSDDASMTLLDKRDASILASISYQLLTPVGMFELSGGGETLDEHDGKFGTIAYRLPLRTGKLSVTPFTGYTYYDDKFNNHLYGVSAAESARTGGSIAAFDVDDGGEFFAGARVNYTLTEQLMVSSSLRYLSLRGDIKDSPMLEKTESTTVSLGLSYRF
jgi:outer membrane protein